MLKLNCGLLRDAAAYFCRRAESLVVNGGLSEREVSVVKQMKLACDAAASMASDLEELEAAILDEIKSTSTTVTVSAVSNFLPTAIEVDYAPSHLGEVREPVKVRCELHTYSASNGEATYSVHFPEESFDRPALRARDVMPVGAC